MKNYNLDLDGVLPLKVSADDRENVIADYRAAQDFHATYGRPEAARAYLDLELDAMFPVEVESAELNPYGKRVDGAAWLGDLSYKAPEAMSDAERRFIRNEFNAQLDDVVANRRALAITRVLKLVKS